MIRLAATILLFEIKSLLRDASQFWVVPISYIFFWFYLNYIYGVFHRDFVVLNECFEPLPWILGFGIPILLARSWRHDVGRQQILYNLSKPLPVFSSLLARFVVHWAYWSLWNALCVSTILSLEYYGASDRGSLVSAFIGLCLFSGLYIALVQSLIISIREPWLGCFLAILLFSLTQYFSSFGVGFDSSSSTLFGGIYSLSPLRNLLPFLMGVVGLHEIIFFVFYTIFFLVMGWFALTAMKRGWITLR